MVPGETAMVRTGLSLEEAVRVANSRINPCLKREGMVVSSK